MCCKSWKCSITLEITTSGANVSLPESNRIRNSRVVGISMPRAAGATLYSPNNAVLAADAVVGSSYLNLVNANGTKILADLPLNQIQRDYNAPEPLHVNWSDIDPTQSNVQINTSASGYNAAHAMIFIFWLDCDNCGVPE